METGAATGEATGGISLAVMMGELGDGTTGEHALMQRQKMASEDK